MTAFLKILPPVLHLRPEEKVQRDVLLDAREEVELESTGGWGTGPGRKAKLGEDPTLHREHRGMWILICGFPDENKGENHLTATQMLRRGDAGRTVPGEDKAFGN